jgi:hypothetical protein
MNSPLTLLLDMTKKEMLYHLDMVCASLMVAASILVPFALYFYGVLPL